MKKIIALSALLIVLVPLAVLAEELEELIETIPQVTQEETIHKPRYLKFEGDFCKQISKNPTMTVCVSGEAGSSKLKAKHVRRFKRGAKQVLKQYKKFQKTFDQKYNTSTSSCTFDDWDPAECDPSGQDQSYCESNPHD